MRINPIVLMAGVASATLCAHTLIDDEGYPAVRRLEAKRVEMSAHNQRLEAENEQLRAEVALLEEPGPYLTKIVRDELGYVREGEVIFRFKGE